MIKPHEETGGENEAVPRNLDDFLKTLTRRLVAADPNCWMRCASQRCHRARRCVEPDVRCYAPSKKPPMSEEERAQASASLLRALRARMRG